MISGTFQVIWVYQLKSRYQEWSHLHEPHPPQPGYWRSRFARRPNVRLIWFGNKQIMEMGSDLGDRNSARSFTYARLNRPLTRTFPCEDWSLTSLKEKRLKIGANIESHDCYVAFQMTEVDIPKNLFADESSANFARRPLQRLREVFGCHAFEANSLGTHLDRNQLTIFVKLWDVMDRRKFNCTGSGVAECQNGPVEPIWRPLPCHLPVI
jgi:hypothetical protein